MGEEQPTGLVRAINWKAAFWFGLAVVTDWAYLSGYSISEMGKWAPLAWWFTIGLQGIFLLAMLEVAVMYKDLAGGLPTYITKTYERTPFGKVASLLTSWGYFAGWGIAVGSVALFAGEFAKWLVGADPVATAIIVITLCLLVNLVGIKRSGDFQTYTTFAIFITVVTLGIASFVKLPPIVQTTLPTISQPDANPLWVFIGLAFTLAWTTYASEIVLDLVPEVKDPLRDTRKGIILAVLFTILGSSLILAALYWHVPLDVIINEPYTPLLPLCQSTFGMTVTYVFGVILLAGLIGNTNSCFVATSRVLYEASRQGYLPRFMGKVNRFHSPQGSLLFIFVVNLLLVLAVGEQPLFLLVAGNLGYVLVMVLANFVPYLSRRLYPDVKREYRVPDWLVYAAVAIGLVNIVLMVFGITYYGAYDTLVGLGVLLTVVPLYIYRKWEDSRHSTT